MLTEFWWGNLMERAQLKDLDIDGRIIANWIFKKWDGEAQTGFPLAEDRYRWWLLVNAVLNLWFQKMPGIS
jgi:hypothetical protein